MLKGCGFIKAFLVLLLLTGCTHSDEKTEPDKKAEGKDTAAEETIGLPQVTSEDSNSSRPLSDYSGSAKNKKNDELYIVPNRFPEKDSDKHESQKEQQETEEPPSNQLD